MCSQHRHLFMLQLSCPRRQVQLCKPFLSFPWSKKTKETASGQKQNSSAISLLGIQHKSGVSKNDLNFFNHFGECTFLWKTCWLACLNLRKKLRKSITSNAGETLPSRVQYHDVN
eukprot:1138300-Pelagomonas_calceolata.AAC.5